MAYNTFTSSDVAKLLSNPGVFSYRAKGSTDAFTPAFFANGAAWAKTTEVATVAFDDVGDVQDLVNKETAELTVSSARVLDWDFISAVSGGLWVKSTTDGTPVTGHSQSVAAGWAYNKFILLDKQNGDKTVKQTIASVTASTDGALVEKTDYDQVYLPEVGWGIVISSGGKVTILNQSITVVFGYTPAATEKITSGGVKSISALELRFETIGADGKAVDFDFYNCFPDGNIGHGFSPENSADPVTMDLKFTAKCDTSRAVGDQLCGFVKTL